VAAASEAPIEPAAPVPSPWPEVPLVAVAPDPGPATEAGPATVFPGDLMRPLVVPPRRVRIRLWLRRLLPARTWPRLGRSGR
jgi:hypothetical protein